MTEFIVIWIAALVMVMAMDNAYADTFQTTTGTVTAEVISPESVVVATEDGCEINEVIVDCETLEPAGGSDEDE